MPAATGYIFIVSMDVEPEFEALFNEVYDTEHIPSLLEVPGVRAAWRMKGAPFGVAIGGEIKQQEADSPLYSAIYEIDSPEVLTSPEWAAAVEKGRWPGEVRPHTKNRRHALMQVL